MSSLIFRFGAVFAQRLVIHSYTNPVERATSLPDLLGNAPPKKGKPPRWKARVQLPEPFRPNALHWSTAQSKISAQGHLESPFYGLVET